MFGKYALQARYNSFPGRIWPAGCSLEAPSLESCSNPAKGSKVADF